MPFIFPGQVGNIVSLQTHPRVLKWGCLCLISECSSIFPETGTRYQRGTYSGSQQPPTMPGAGNPRLDQGQLDRLVRSLFIEGLAPSTIKAYACGQCRYVKFCASAGLVAMPARKEVLCKFVAHMAIEGLKHQTIKSYMAGVRHHHIQEGLGDPLLPVLPRLHYVLRGVKRSQGGDGASGRQRLPITPHLLRQIKAAWEDWATDPDIVML